MSESSAVDVALLVFRVGLGGVMIAHGWNHIWGGGRIDGTAGWFGSLGMRSPRLHAWLASITELVGGALLVLGLLTPFGGAAVVGVMVVAWAINHRGNGFFIFRPGEGWEYVMILGLCGGLIGATGAGRLSLDHAVGIGDQLDGWPGLAIAAGAGVVGAGLLLLVWWRPAAEDQVSGEPVTGEPATGE